MKNSPQSGFTCSVPEDWDDYNRRVQERLGTVAAKELAARSLALAIAKQAPPNCDEIDCVPGPPRFVVYKERGADRIRTFKVTLPWTLVEVRESKWPVK